LAPNVGRLKVKLVEMKVIMMSLSVLEVLKMSTWVSRPNVGRLKVKLVEAVKVKVMSVT
jgi:hypothetical protein